MTAINKALAQQEMEEKKTIPNQVLAEEALNKEFEKQVENLIAATKDTAPKKSSILQVKEITNSLEIRSIISTAQTWEAKVDFALSSKEAHYRTRFSMETHPDGFILKWPKAENYLRFTKMLNENVDQNYLGTIFVNHKSYGMLFKLQKQGLNEEKIFCCYPTKLFELNRRRHPRHTVLNPPIIATIENPKIIGHLINIPLIEISHGGFSIKVNSSANFLAVGDVVRGIKLSFGDTKEVTSAEVKSICEMELGSYVRIGFKFVTDNSVKS